MIVMENAKYHSRFAKHDEGWNDCFYVKVRYWDSEYNSNKVGVVGENYLKKYWKKRKGNICPEDWD